MTRDDLTPEQELAVCGLEGVLSDFSAALEQVRASELPVVDAFRLAGIEIPSFVPSSILENLLAPA